MELEIGRKFITSSLPGLKGILPVENERYYLFYNGTIEIRIDRYGEKHYFERKEKISNLSRNNIIFEITKDEFNLLKQKSISRILRDAYSLGENLSIKIYKNKYKGLIRAEIDFSNEQEANEFVKQDWMGNEISDSKLGKDGELSKLSKEKFLRNLNMLKKPL